MGDLVFFWFDENVDFELLIWVVQEVEGMGMEMWVRLEFGNGFENCGFVTLCVVDIVEDLIVKDERIDEIVAHEAKFGFFIVEQTQDLIDNAVNGHGCC